MTGFSENNWRLRYVGEDAASLIKSEGICYEEYYAYFVDKNKTINNVFISMIATLLNLLDTLQPVQAHPHTELL